ncbi:MAG: ABC transporter permease subunit [Oscillospiraceae bacterium]|nr:ABC transporter permease subunit [Oscillospiraceae bacterium]
MALGQAALMVLGSLAAVAALCALLTLVAANCERTSVSAAACVLGVFLLLIASIYIRSRLLAPEYLNGSWNAAGEYVPGLPTPNPQYLGGPQRTVFEVLNVFLPTCQIVQYASQQGQDAGWMALWALAVAALSTAAGIALFRRKDLK